MEDFFRAEVKTEYGYRASLMNFESAKTIKIPQILKDEIPTLNQYGFMKVDFDEYTENFIERSKNVEYSMDIGCAYGQVIRKLLENGNKAVAFDMSPDHLRVLGFYTKKEYLENLFLVEGKLPGDFDFPDEKFGSILASRILHFLTGEEFDESLKKIHRALEPEGKLYITCVTPYHVAVRDGFLEEYERRRIAGIKWPGEIENQWEMNPKHKQYVQPFLHVFDDKELQKIIPEYGFKINKISMFDYPNDTDSGGVGHVGLEATKI